MKGITSIVRSLLKTLGSLCLITFTVNSQELPVYEVRRAAAPITVDGKLTDAAWTTAPAVGDFVNNRDGSPSVYKTEARVL